MLIFSPAAFRAIVSSKVEAIRNGESYVSACHLVFALARDTAEVSSVALRTLLKMNHDTDLSLAYGELSPRSSGLIASELNESRTFRDALQQAEIEAAEAQSRQIECEHLLVAVLTVGDELIQRFCQSHDLTIDKVRAEIQRLKHGVVFSEAEITGMRRLRELTGTENLVDALGEANRRLDEYGEVFALLANLRLAGGSATNVEALVKAYRALQAENQEGWQTARSQTSLATGGP